MGVPKFFRYTSERYPCLNELVKQYQIPDFDNMYLDMNGIIHNCSHPDDSNPHFRITEEKIFQDIFHYLSILFQIIKPKKLFFMAIDGVAPRAKMNQQRGRRFRSAREAEKLEEEAKAKGETLPTEKRFDSNCITPGTAFMARLHEQLRYFVKQKMSSDPLWAKVKVILSGHETPGEGEHKIMDYIRWARSQPDYDPNTRHCLYGLDADLIMLGMCTHEPHFALLREEVKFGKSTQRATSPEDTNFYLLHLSLLKEYLEQEFISIKHKLPFSYDIEKIVDDWVLMGFLVGNDFIPHLPNMHISNDAMPILYKTYMDVLPTLDGYINESGDLNLKRFEVFMQELAKIDKEKFQDTYADLKYFEAKTGRRPNANERKEYKPNNDETFNVDVSQMKGVEPDTELQALINATQEMLMDDLAGDDDDDEYEDIDSSDDEANFNMEFLLHKKDYYMNKLDYSKVTDEVLASQAEGYVRAIQWNLYYYYRGCPSWCWYYPHHYAPYISDIKGFSGLDIKFELGEPFKPFEQLLAVLPSASKQLLPTPFHSLMTDEDSPIVHYYPVNFETDLNGKINDWEAVVLIPFIDETNLLLAMEPCYQRLTDEERKRNTHGPMLVYNWSKDSQGLLFDANNRPTPIECHAIEKQIFRKELEVPFSQLKRGVLPNARRDLLYPGFPTMRHLKYQTSIKKCKVRVFDQPSRNENMIVQLIRDAPEKPLEDTAKELLGKVVWVGWPHLTKALVISVSNEKQRLHKAKDGGHSVEQNAGNLHKQWISERSTVIEHNMNRLGIELGDVTTLIHAVNLKGYKYILQDNIRMAQSPEWCTVACGYALQAIVTDVSEHIAPGVTRYSTPEEAYPKGDKVFLLTTGQYYGCEATVVDASCARSGRIKVSVECQEQPAPAAATHAAPYRAANHAAASVGITTQLLSRVTGSILVVAGEIAGQNTERMHKTNIGLNLKFNKKNQEVSGYTRRCPVTNTWQYSIRCIELVESYVRQYPELFDQLARNLSNDVFTQAQLFPGTDGKEKLTEISAWLKSQPHNSAIRRECGSEALEPEELEALAKCIDRQLKEIKPQPPVTLHVKWSLLYKPDLHQGNVPPDAAADFKMYDRVVCAADNITVPKGTQGTITAVYQPGQHNTVRLSDKLNSEAGYQVLFDRTFPGAMTEADFSQPRLYRMQPSFLINISYGRNLRTLVTTNDHSDSYTKNHIVKRDTSGRNTVLRTEGHASAFANYSLPKEPSKQSPLDNRITVNTKAPMNEGKDDGSELLKSLLKISGNHPIGYKENKTSSDGSNWRVKKESDSQAAQLSQRMHQQSWRKETLPVNNTPQVQPPGPGEWINSNFKQSQAVPPFPNLSALPLPSVSAPPFPFPHPTNLPQGYQQNQNQYQNNQNQYQHNNQFNRNQQKWSQPQNGHFPTSLSNVPLPNFGAMGEPNAQRKETTSNKSKKNENIDKLINPFVPLQVQASQRRVQNPRGPSNISSSAAAAAAAKPVPVHPVAGNNTTKPTPQNTEKKPQRKRRPRIAANLPFQAD